ncbi:MAG: PHB depolymerase family esterase [bacterium]
MRTPFLLAMVALLGACSAGSPHPSQSTPSDPSASSRSTATPVNEAASTRVQASPEGCFGRGPGDYVDAIEREEGQRSFRIHVPPAYDGYSSVPLLFNFHGQSRSAEDQEFYSGLVPVSDANDFILVSPEGGFAQWNIVGIYAEDGIDDVAAVADILAYASSEFCVDADRVFATGMSNGAEMAAQVACLMPGVFAGIAPVAGIEFQGCEGPPVAVITFHGTDDYNVPYDTAPEAVAEWARYNGCPEEPEVERVAEQVTRESYFGCEGAPVVFYTIEGGGHTWPGAADDAGGVGATNHEISASELIWDLFGRIRRTP